ncbi:peptide-binding protein [Litchfieldia salsa]|uniref:Peptide/nickel transport system substrate-binding protein n=1 Tax=Litchfieldia salsa TaxID=930152 RepID=A0A1H0S7S1_9BACI|nr:peptide-binding protein [Litchfieldia salsa]SDP37278.1 peptide/nickel transport system substrate-binding protein [Litchfieldia salsa]
MNFKKSAWFLLCLTFAMSLFLAACSGGNTAEEPAEKPEETPAEEPSGEPVQGGDLIAGSIGEPTLFNPYYSTDVPSSDIEGLIYNGLLTSDEKFEPQMDLAESVDQSEDGLTFTVKLREDVKFHDGEQMTADDVVFSYSIPLQEDYIGERGSNFESLESVTKIDDYTVEFKLNKVDVTFYPITLSYAVLPEHLLKDVPVGELGENEFNTKAPVGTGPFKFEEWKDGEYVKVVANDDYHEGRPYLDSITYKIVPDQNSLLAQLQAGDIDFMVVPGTDIETAKGFSGIKIESDLALSYTYLGFNQQQERFQDPKVRQALTHAVNRQEIVDAVMNGDGQIANVPESPLSWAYNDEVPVFEYDPEKAKSLLAEAGWEDTDGDGILDKDGEKFSFVIKTNQGNKIREDIVVVLQQQFKEIGIEATPEIVEWSAYIEQISAPNWDYDALVLGWSLSTFPDASDIFHSNQIEEGLNFVWYKNEEADKLMEKAKTTIDQDEYKELYSQIYKIIAEDQAYTFLYYPNVHRAMPENLQGYVFNAKSDFYDANKWWLAE